ncbi:MAG: HK97 gp10 family phage protein [Ectothiorhodospira sp.]
MSEFRIEIQTEALEAALRRAPGEVTAAVDRKLERGAFEIARELKRTGPKATSQTINSVHVRRRGPMDWAVGPTAQSAVYVELGRRPGGRMPPPRALADWAMTKLRISDRTERARAGFLIARAIQRRGIEPRPWVRPIAASPQWARRIADLVERGVQQGLDGLEAS